MAKRAVVAAEPRRPEHMLLASREPDRKLRALHAGVLMRVLPLLAGGIVAGAVIIAGEAALNLAVLADDWAALFERFGMAAPDASVALQGILKLLLLGVATVWLAGRVDRSGGRQWASAALLAGLIVWFLVWAWVQWGMWLAGYVTARVAIWTVLWGLIELPLAALLGTALAVRLGARADHGDGETPGAVRSAHRAQAARR